MFIDLFITICLLNCFPWICLIPFWACWCCLPPLIPLAASSRSSLLNVSGIIYFFFSVLNQSPVTSAGCSSFVKFGEKKGVRILERILSLQLYIFSKQQIKFPNRATTQLRMSEPDTTAWDSVSTPTQICKHSLQNSVISSLMKRQSTLQHQRPLP